LCVTKLTQLPKLLCGCSLRIYPPAFGMVAACAALGNRVLELCSVLSKNLT
jgi:hypothetical protein